MYPVSLEELIDEFEKMPGIGHKSAVRLAFYIMNMPEAKAERFVAAVTNARTKVHLCERCQNLTDKPLCDVCASDKRDRGVICVMESPKDVTAMEKTGEYKGLYHVLHGAISPMDGVGPDDIKIRELLARLTPEVKEIIMATNPTVEGEATAMYVARLVKPLGVKATRLAYGLPVGSNLEYADEVTLGRSLANRGEL